MKHDEPGRSTAPRRVLVVDDDDAFRASVVAVLSADGYHVTEAAGALSAMRAVLSTPLDVVVLDLILPDGHGIEVARAFRAVATTRDICVVAMTARPGSVEFVSPRSFGAAAILIKPIAPAALLEAVAACFGDEEVTGEFEVPERPLSS